MAIRVLGPFEVEGLENRRMGGPQQRAVLALLALRPNEAVRSGRLIQEIWGDDAAPNAKKTLQVYVSGLRRALADRDEKITTVGGAYRLDVAPDDIDAMRFEALIDEAESTESAEQQLLLLDEQQAPSRPADRHGLVAAESGLGIRRNARCARDRLGSSAHHHRRQVGEALWAAVRCRSPVNSWAADRSPMARPDPSSHAVPWVP